MSKYNHFLFQTEPLCLLEKVPNLFHLSFCFHLYCFALFCVILFFLLYFILFTLFCLVLFCFALFYSFCFVLFYFSTFFCVWDVVFWIFFTYYFIVHFLLQSTTLQLWRLWTIDWAIVMTTKWRGLRLWRSKRIVTVTNSLIVQYNWEKIGWSNKQKRNQPVTCP